MAAYNAALHLTGPTTPRNLGCFRPVDVMAPPTRLVNVVFSAPEGGSNTESHPRIVGTMLAAMAKGLRDRAMASEAGTHCSFAFGGDDAVSGQPDR